MKLRISNGKIRLENKIIDFSNFEAYSKIRDIDLERYYEEFIEHVGEIREYFKDKNTFEKVVNEATFEKRPKLIARETKYPFLWFLRSSFTPFDFLEPKKRRLHDKYFMASRCLTQITRKRKVAEKDKDERQETLDEKLQEDISEKFKQFPGCEGIIEIPNDRNPHETKSSTFHEATHYLVARYLEETGENFVNVFIKENLSTLEKYRYERVVGEGVVEILTDKLLMHDKEALFEARWPFYLLSNKGLNAFRLFVGGGLALTTGALLWLSFTKPYLFPLVFIPGRIRDLALKKYKYKESKKGEILKPIEYPKFEI